MINQSEEEAYLLFVELNIKELEERVKALENIIASMKVKGEDTRNQSDLLLNMLRTIKIAQAFYSEATDRLKEDPLERRTRPRIAQEAQ
jgi:transposase-like protein